MYKNYIIIHHSGITHLGAQFHSINSYHRRRGFPKSSLSFYGGYQLLIDTDKQIKRYRTDDELGAHTRGIMNKKAIGICVAGDFTQQEPQEWQKKLLRNLVQRLQRLYQIPDNNVLLHRDIRPTLCPGINWKMYLKSVPIDLTLSKRAKNALFRAIERSKKRFRGRRLRRILDRLQSKLDAIKYF